MCVICVCVFIQLGYGIVLVRLPWCRDALYVRLLYTTAREQSDRILLFRSRE